MARNAAARRKAVTASAPPPPPEPEQEPEQDEDEAPLDEEPEGDSEAMAMLREEALQHEVEYDEHTTEEELRTLVDQAKEAELEAHRAQVAENARLKAQPSAGAPPRPKAGTGRTSAKAKELRARIGLPAQDKIQALKLGQPTDKDYELADQYGYPIAIPDAKPYQISISIYCPFGGGDRPAGSVMLIHDAYAANKREYLTPL